MTLLALAAVACTAASAGTTMSVLASGSYARDDSGRKAVLATTEAEYAQRWAELIGDDGKAPAVDFANASVVFLLAGPRSSGGWTIEPGSVTMEGRTAVIEAKVAGPPPGGIATMAITTPWIVLRLDGRDADQVRWAE